MKKVFLDCGAHIGESIQTFIRYWSDWKEYEIHSFEANPELTKHFDQFKSHNNVHFHPVAVWIDDGMVDFYICSSHNKVGSSINANKNSLTKNYINVKSVDIAQFILTTFEKTDHIVMKIDIEGSEYDVIPHLINTGAINFIDEMYIETHALKVKLTEDDDDKLFESIRVANPNLHLYTDTSKSLNFR